MSSQEGVELLLLILPAAVSVFLSISDVMINPLFTFIHIHTFENDLPVFM